MTKEVRSYRDLVAWQRGMELVREIYRVSRNFPKDEIFGLVSQIRRAAVSIPSNIAEGHQKLSRKEYQHFLGNARASVAEVETQILIARVLSKQLIK
jgi:four helix bundle protein